MYLVNISQDVDECKQLLLLKYLVSLSSRASISRYYNGYMEEDKFAEMQSEYKAKLLHRAEKRRKDYENNIDGFRDRIDSWYDTRDRVMNYFDDLEEQELEVYDLVTLDMGDEHIDNPDIDGIISSYFTRTTEVTEGPVQQVIYFEVEAIQKYVVNRLTGLYDFPYIIQGHKFEDLTLYRGDDVILAICSHENFAHMFLKEDEAKKIINRGFIKRDALIEV